MNYIIPLLLIALVCFSSHKKVNNYNTFIKGAEKSLTLVKDIFAYVLAIFIIIELFRVSGLSLLLQKLCMPLFNVLGIPSELCELLILKPFSGSGSLALLNEVYASFGVDTYIGRCASVMLASSETVFYVSAVYFSKTKVKKLGYAIPLALFMSIFSAWLACLMCKII